MSRSQAEHHAWNPLLPLLSDTCGKKRTRQESGKKLTKPHCYLSSHRCSSATTAVLPSFQLAPLRRGKKRLLERMGEAKGVDWNRPPPAKAANQNSERLIGGGGRGPIGKLSCPSCFTAESRSLHPAASRVSRLKFL